MMQQMCRTVQWLVLVSMAICPCARAGSKDLEAQTQELARQILDGRQAVVRLYCDWRADPKSYTTLSVPLAGLDVMFDAVAQAAGRSVPEDAVVVVVPDDQQDATIAEMMGECLFGERYRESDRITLSPGTIPWVQLNPCVFEDALQQPIPNAEVEILLSSDPVDSAADCKVWVATSRLDENGRMASLKASASCRLHAFLFVVIHPDCGPVMARSLYSISKPGQDHLLSVGALPKEKWGVFLDAQGVPIPRATVEMFAASRWEYVHGLPFAIRSLDESGRLCPPPTCTLLDMCCFVVSDPNYGIAIVEPYDKMYGAPMLSLATAVVPLVPIGTRADERSIWGTILDNEGRPVANAVVGCNTVVIAGGTRLHPYFIGSFFFDKSAKVLTNEQGQFAMHVPLMDGNGNLGRPVPPEADYEVTIEAPNELGLEPLGVSLRAGQEHTITMQSTTPGPKTFTGTLVFYDAHGPVTDPVKLAVVNLTIDAIRLDGGHVVYSYSQGSWLEQTELPFGTYRATADWEGMLYAFGPVEVTADSPQTIAVTPASIKAGQATYCGRVVHGVTGQPISQAVVMKKPAVSDASKAGLDDEYLDLIRYFGPEVDPNGGLLRVLEEDASWEMVRTDAEGRYEITLAVAEQTDPSASLVAIRKDFLGAEQQLQLLLTDLDGQTQYKDFPPDRTGKIPLPDMKLFPAGTVLVEPVVPAETDIGRYVRFDYFTSEENSTSWLKDLWATPLTNQGGSVFRTCELPLGRSQIVYVPAEVSLTLSIVPLDEHYAPTVVDGVRLAQSDVLDLGAIGFAETFQVVVKVVDSAGNPLEGITVQRLDDRDLYTGCSAVTDVAGKALIFVPPHTQGQFIVAYRTEGSAATIHEGIPYSVAGPEDAGREFVLVLSDEFLEQLRSAP